MRVTLLVIPFFSLPFGSLAGPIRNWLWGYNGQVTLGESQMNEEEVKGVGMVVNVSDVSTTWRDPKLGGGSMLSYVTKLKGEPLNVIISGQSDPKVLTDEGLKEYSKSIGFSSECFGLHYGGYQSANLGDGSGQVDQLYLARQSYFDTVYGPCWETVIGGNHFRAWKQNGTEANTGAWFLAVSIELALDRKHTIARDGYNAGRDWLVERAVKGGKWKDDHWIASVEWTEGLLEPGCDGINHGIPQDGRVAVLTVSRVTSV